MSNKIKKQSHILKKLGIEQLNPMQQEAGEVIKESADTILLSPTGTGKTLAFLLPIVAELDPENEAVQALILAPSRELAIQIEQVFRDMGTGYKANAVYGGQSISKDKLNLKHPPTVLIGTPGRVADHLRRQTFDKKHIHTLVLDEFDKSLEIGFEEEMEEILNALPQVEKKVLTSATMQAVFPDFIRLKRPAFVNYLHEKVTELTVKTIVSPEKDKLETLLNSLKHIGNKPGIIFCNYKDSIQRISDFLAENGVAHGCFYGGMEQQERERALVMFRNGSHQLLIATDLAARGIDVPEIQFILHYHLPHAKEEFTHRNGRTARMHKEGTAYVLHWKEEILPDFINGFAEEKLKSGVLPTPPSWKTVFISGGRKDKISKGDIAGLFFKQGNLEKGQLGVIELKQDCAFAAVQADALQGLIERVDNTKLKNKKVRVKLIE